MAWYLKQLLPLRYHTTYRLATGERRYATWRMWLGRCFDCIDVGVA